MITITTTWTHLTPRDRRPPTVYEALCDRLGRPATDVEAIAEVRRLYAEWDHREGALNLRATSRVSPAAGQTG